MAIEHTGRQLKWARKGKQGLLKERQSIQLVTLPVAPCPDNPDNPAQDERHRDLNGNQHERNWLANNLRVAAALAEAGYNFRLVLGDGGHSPNHGDVLLPDALRWLHR